MSEEGIILDVKKRYDSKYTFLYLKQIPKTTAQSFTELANNDFGGHFGFCLKALLDGTIALNNELDIERLDMIEKRLDAIEQLITSTPKQEKVRRTVGGRIIKGNGD